MKSLKLYCWCLGLALSVTGVFPSRACAKDVDIVVSGPWAFADDPFNSNHIVLVVVNEEHEVHLMHGDNVYAYWNTPGHFDRVKAGYYSFDFSTQCNGGPSSNARFYPIPGVTDIQSRINNSSRGKRIAISLPRPCSYSEVQPSRVLLADGEKTFTTITKLHYIVDDTTTSARVSSNGDNGETVVTPFNFRSAAGAYQDVALVAGSTTGHFDQKCDHHSGDMFDRSLRFWGQTPVPRLFRGVDASTGQQTNYDFSCKGLVAARSGKPAIVPNQSDTNTPSSSVSSDRRNPSRTDCHAPQLMITMTAK